MEKANLERLLERKLKRNNEIYKDIEVKELDLSFTVKKLELSQYLHIMDSYKGMEDTISGNFEMYKEIIYNSVPLLHDKKLQEEYGCHEPFDIVPAVFEDNLMAISNFALSITSLYGVDSESLTKEIKN